MKQAKSRRKVPAGPGTIIASISLKKSGRGKPKRITVHLATYPMRGWSTRKQATLSGLIGDYAQGWAE